MLVDIVKAIILGIIEGITEFFPISSTGHLILAGDFLNFSSANQATFNISIQLGAMLAVLVLYFDFFKKTFAPKNWFGKNMNNIIIAIFPALVVGFLFHKLIKEYLFSTYTVIAALIVGGIIMLVTEKLISHKPNTIKIENISYKQALIIGLCQCFAFWPGMSRSGSAIVGGLFAKLDHKTAAEFSFIIGVPLMFIAVIYELLTSFANLAQKDFLLIGIAFLVSFFFGIIAIRSLLNILNRFKLFPFAVYRIVLAIFIVLISF
ncbi:undecaprenyl-diphosphate phosphatase [Candidatus Margulisiibacteriota bacterium]